MLGSNTQLYAQGNADAANFIIITISKKDVVMDKAPKQPMTHINTHTQSNQSSITILMKHYYARGKDT
jgi:hypothetical protein